MLARRITLGLLILYGVGDILGAGIYGLIGKAAGEMGNVVWLGFLASAVAAGLTGLSYASIGSRHPKAGGVSYVTHRAFGHPLLAYVAGLAMTASGLTSMAVASRAFAGYFTALFGGSETIVILAFALVLGLIVLAGIREALWVNALCTVIELAGLLVILAVGARFLGSVDYFDASTGIHPHASLSAGVILSGAVLTFYSFVGFEDILNVSEEVVKPERTLPIGLLAAVAISSFIYVAISVVAISVVPAAELAASSRPLVTVVEKAAPSIPVGVYTFIALFAVANTALLNTVMSSRLMYGMAKQGLLPKPLARVHARRKTPYVATFVVIALLLGLAFAGDMATLAKATSVMLLLCFALMNTALVVLKRRKGEAKGHFEIPVAIPVLGTLVCLAMLGAAQREELTIAGALIGAIALLYSIQRPSAHAIRSLES